MDEKIINLIADKLGKKKDAIKMDSPLNISFIGKHLALNNFIKKMRV